MTLERCAIDELRTLFLFEKLSDEQLGWLCEHGHVESIESGWVYRENETAESFYVLLSGSLALSRLVGPDDVEVSRTDQPGVYGGAIRAYLDDRAAQGYLNSMRVLTPCRFFVIGAADFSKLMHSWFPMAVHLLEGLFFGIQNTQQVIGERERLLALGSLSAGLTHELNNPAAAAVRATVSLRERVAGMRSKLAMISSGKYDPATLQSLIKLQEQAVDFVAKAPALSAIEASDREDDLSDWLESHGITNAWELASTFVEAGLDPAFLDRVVAAVDPVRLEGSIRWLGYTVETELLLNEIEDSTNRVSTLVSAAKQYSQLDRAPYQIVDVHELLDSTLLMMGRKLGDGITVVKEYDRALPRVPAYAAEINQVFTNLIDNAVGAMDGSGTLTIRTSREEDNAVVEIGDTGSGIPADVRPRIFEPFFSTKPFGEGTGLGLDISWRIVVNKHHGDLRVESVPGDTRFSVRLPLTPPDATLEVQGEQDPPVGSPM